MPRKKKVPSLVVATLGKQLLQVLKNLAQIILKWMQCSGSTSFGQIQIHFIWPDPDLLHLARSGSTSFGQIRIHFRKPGFEPG